MTNKQKEVKETVIEKRMNISDLTWHQRIDKINCIRSYYEGVIDLAEELGFQVEIINGTKFHGRCCSCETPIFGDDSISFWDIAEREGEICGECELKQKKAIEYVSKRATEGYNKLMNDIREEFPLSLDSFVLIPMTSDVDFTHIALHPCGKESSLNLDRDPLVASTESFCNCDLCKYLVKNRINVLF